MFVIPGTALAFPWWMARLSVLQAAGPELIFGVYTLHHHGLMLQSHHVEMVKILRSAAPCLVPPGSYPSALPTDCGPMVTSVTLCQYLSSQWKAGPRYQPSSQPTADSFLYHVPAECHLKHVLPWSCPMSCSHS